MGARHRHVAIVALLLVASACTRGTTTSTTESIPPAAPTSSVPPPSTATSTTPARSRQADVLAPADVILTNGRIITVDDNFAIAEAVAITDGDIVAVGTDVDVSMLVGPETVVVDLEGRAVLPGFIDPHTHALQQYAYLPDLEAMRAAQDDLLSGGVTTTGTPNVKPDDLAGFEALEAAGDVTIRNHLYLTYNDECGDRSYGDYYLKQDFSRDPELRQTIAGVKMFADGGVCNAPAMSVAYPSSVPDGLKDRGWVGNGGLFVSPQEVASVVGTLDALGAITVIHAIGDDGIRTALAGLVQAFDEGPFDNPQRIDHNSFTSLLSEDELALFGKVDMVPVVFPLPFANGCESATADVWRSLLVPAVFDVLENSKALRDANPGMRISWHGDAPSVPGHPLQIMFTLVAGGAVRVDTGEVCYPEAWSGFYTVTAEEAIRMTTINAAAAMGIEERVGSIEVGKVADLIVLAEDPLGLDHEVALAGNYPLVTMINGEVYFCADVVCGAFRDIAAVSDSETEPPPQDQALDAGPEWSFDVDGDTEGWSGVSGIGKFEASSGNLVLESLDNDPWIVSEPTIFSAAYDTMLITMRVSEGASTIGQVFFLTDGDPTWDETKSLVFDVIADGEFHDYTLDMSMVRGWDGLIAQLRLDPVAASGLTVDIDRVAFPG